jgi:hypothetical protein
MSIYARLAAWGALALLVLALLFDAYHSGFTKGQAEVQARWDKQSAALSQQTTAAVQAAASDALANYQQAGASVALAEQHKADQAEFSKSIIDQVKSYASKQTGSSGTVAGAAGSGAVLGGPGACGLDADGLRIWNDANAGAAGSSGSSASDSAGQPAGNVR